MVYTNVLSLKWNWDCHMKLENVMNGSRYPSTCSFLRNLPTFHHKTVLVIFPLQRAGVLCSNTHQPFFSPVDHIVCFIHVYDYPHQCYIDWSFLSYCWSTTVFEKCLFWTFANLKIKSCALSSFDLSAIKLLCSTYILKTKLLSDRWRVCKYVLPFSCSVSLLFHSDDFFLYRHFFDIVLFSICAML